MLHANRLEVLHRLVVHKLCSSNRPLEAKMEFGDIWKNLTSLCKNLTSTGKNLTEFNKILDGPDCSAENCCPKIVSRLEVVKFCQILSNFYKLEAEIRQLPSNVSYVHLSSNYLQFKSDITAYKMSSTSGEIWRDV